MVAWDNRGPATNRLGLDQFPATLTLPPRRVTTKSRAAEVFVGFGVDADGFADFYEGGDADL